MVFHVGCWIPTTTISKLTKNKNVLRRLVYKCLSHYLTNRLPCLRPVRFTSTCFYATTNPHASSATRHHSSGVHSPRTPSSEVMYLRQPCAHNKTSGFTTLARSQRFTAHQAGQRRPRHQPMSSYDSRALHSDFQEFTLPFTSWCSSHPGPTDKSKTD